MAEGFLKPIIDMTDAFYQVGLNQFDWHKKIQGTECLVSRVKRSSDYRDVFGSVYTSTLQDDEDNEEFKYTILINLNNLSRLFQQSITQLDFYDNKDVLQLGDVIKFVANGYQYRYKITDIQIFGTKTNFLNQYTISGMAEVASTRKTGEDY